MDLVPTFANITGKEKVKSSPNVFVEEPKYYSFIEFEDESSQL